MGYYFELTNEEESELQYQEHLKQLYEEEMYILQKDKQRLLGISGEPSDADNKTRTPF